MGIITGTLAVLTAPLWLPLLLITVAILAVLPHLWPLIAIAAVLTSPVWIPILLLIIIL